MASVAQTYADALFTLISESNSERSAFDGAMAQMESVRDVIAATPDFVKFLGTPTISDGDKLSLVEKAFSSGAQSDGTSVYVYNFLRLLTVKKRMGDFPQIYKSFRSMYNERFNIAEITITSSMALTAATREKISTRMAAITGKTVLLTEKVDRSIIGGVVVDYGNTRLDGSVKTRLAELKKDISGIIA